MRVGMGLTRDQSIDYANARGIEIPITRSSPYSIDVNLWGRSCETGVLEDPWVTPPDDAYAWTVAPKDAPDPVDIVIGFEGGIPVSIDGETLSGVALVERLHDLGGAHGVGRIDHVEDRLVGIKSREIYEAPAAVILHTAHHALEGLVLSKEQLRFNRLVADELAQIIYDGLWFSALSRDLRTYALSSQRVVSGEVRIRLDHGRASVVGRRSPLSLYDKNLATYDEGDAFDHASAVGFIEIFGLPLRVEAARHGAVGKHHGAAWTWTDPLLADLPTSVAEGEAVRRPDAGEPAAARSPPGPPTVRRRRGTPVPVTTPQRRSSGAAPRRRAGRRPSRVHDAAPRADRPARVPPRVRPARDPRPRLGRAHAHGRGPDDRGDGRGGLLVLPPRPRRRRRLTLAATNGLDREQVGSVSLAMGQGVTGRRRRRAAAPVVSRDVTVDERFSWVRGFDIAGLRAMLSMPLVWNEQVVGVLNVQTTDARDFAPEEVEFLATIAALPRRHRREGPDAGRGRGAAGPPVAAGRGPRRAARRRHPRAADPARRRACLRGPARRRGRATPPSRRRRSRAGPRWT